MDGREEDQLSKLRQLKVSPIGMPHLYFVQNDKPSNTASPKEFKELKVYVEMAILG